MLMVSCGIKAWEILSEHRRRRRSEKGLLRSGHSRNWSLMIVMRASRSVFLMDMIGFVLANFLFLLLFMRIAGYRQMRRLTLISVLGTIGLLYLFVKFVYLPLPKGQFFFEDMTIFHLPDAIHPLK